MIYIPCNDGIVVAADSGFDTAYTENTAILRRGEKIRVINGRFLFSGVGDYSLIEEARELLKTELNKNKKFEDIKAKFLEDFAERKEGYIKRARMARGEDPEEDATKIELDATLLLASFDERNGATAVIISNDMLPTVINSENRLGAVGIGVGESAANLQLEKYKNEELGIEEGSFIAYKVIKDTMSISGSELLEPISIYTMSSKGIEKVNDIKIAEFESTYKDINRMEQQLISDMLRHLRGSTDAAEKKMTKI
ncbi:MAG: hypothetical protein QXZ38_00935 [Candidatus Micrarchaeaceae archaeon]